MILQPRCSSCDIYSIRIFKDYRTRIFPKISKTDSERLPPSGFLRVGHRFETRPIPDRPAQDRDKKRVRNHRDARSRRTCWWCSTDSPAMS